MFKNKVLLISGGTGSFGGAVLRRFLTTNIIGTRHGEKLYEALLRREEMVVAEDMDEYYRIPPDLRDLNYDKFVEQGEERISHAEDYNSYNIERLNIEGMKSLLMNLDFMQAAIRGEFVDSEE